MTARSQPISVGVIGTGGMGARHARNLHGAILGSRVSAVMDVDFDRANAIAADCGGARVFQDAQKLIQDEGVEAVVIASPDPTHVDLTLECLRQSKPVLCEKPLATDSKGAWKVVEEEARLGRHLVQVGFMRRYDPQHLVVKSAVEAGSIGRPFLFKGWHRNEKPASYVTGEAVIINSAIHDLDSSRWLLAQEIEEVFVRGVNTDASLGVDTWDLQLIQLSLGGGCLGTIEVYVNAGYGYEVGVEIVGDEGTAHTPPSEAAVIRHNRTQGQSVEADWLARFDGAYMQELREWIRSLRNGGPTGPSAWDGFTSILAAEQCIESLRSGSPQKVEIPQRPRLY